MKKESESNAVKASKQTETSCSKLKEEMASNLQKKMKKLCFSKQNLMILSSTPENLIVKFVESLRTTRRGLGGHHHQTIGMPKCRLESQRHRHCTPIQKR